MTMAIRKPAKRQMGIERALHWAFGREFARVEFDELSETSGNARGGVDGIWLMMQRGALGCEVDGGGQSEPAWDAEVIASTVSNLPVSHGGKGMAAQVASLARSGSAPDWMPDARPRFRPMRIVENQHGWTAATIDTATLGAEGWQPVKRIGRKGRTVVEPVLGCPVYLTPTAAQIAAARRGYLDWWGALLWIGGELRTLGILSEIEITSAMPPMTPWRNTTA